jgi:hypothetical protein
LKHSFISCWNLDNSESRSVIPGKFENVMLEEDGEVQFNWLCTNEEVLHRVKVESNILHTIKGRKANWIGCILPRNCLLKHVTEGKIQGGIEVIGMQGTKHKQLLMTLRKQKDTGNWKRKHWIVLCQKRNLEETQDLS